jgi:hypothetical protein
MYAAQILAELGTLGGLAYLYFLLLSFRATARRLNQYMQPGGELPTSWAVAGLALAAATFSGYAYNPFLHAVIVIATSAALTLPDSTPGTETQPSTDQPVDDAESDEFLPREGN